jgi:hypothetical protein
MDAATAQVRGLNKALDQYQLEVRLQQQLGGAPSVIGNLVDSTHFSANFTGDGFMVGFNIGFQAPSSGINPLAYGGGLKNGIGFNNLSDLRHIGQGFLQDFRSLLGSIGGFFNHIGGFFRHLFRPVVLDLNGDGVKINPLASSNTFFDMEGDGYQHHTAWAGAGNAVLAYDANNDGVINQKNEIVFTEWDPTATSDMQALRDVFDSNHDGKLDASDAKFARSRAIAMSEVRARRKLSRVSCEHHLRQLAA